VGCCNETHGDGERDRAKIIKSKQKTPEIAGGNNNNHILKTVDTGKGN